MPLNIKDGATHEMARKLAGLTGESITSAVKCAIMEKLEKLDSANSNAYLTDELDRIAIQCAKLVKQDHSTPEEIIGYDQNGLPS